MFSLSGPRDFSTEIRAMTDLVAHRGPDGEGFETWDDAAFGHRRLAILDLSERGRQPMAVGDTYIVHNGEVYNHAVLRTELEGLGCEFHSHTDTEVILHAWRQWGPACLQRFNGMFAFVIYEPRTRRVFAARDRFGVKPLYWWVSPAGFVAFASEIKQFTVLPGWRAELNAQRAYEFLNFGLTDHSADTLFAGVHQLRGGECIDADATTLRDPAAATSRWYTLAPAHVDDGFEGAAAQFRALFTDSVRLRLHADVPVGTALSGGLDSSSIVTTVAELRGGQGEQHTFSACATDARFDERAHVEEVVRRCGTTAHYTYPQLDEFSGQIDKVLWHHDEPVGGASVFAEWEVFRLVASTPVKVTLDGHGADEQLAGYHDFFKAYFAGLFGRGRIAALAREVAGARRRHGHGTRYLATALADAYLPAGARRLARRVGGRPLPTADWMEVGALGVDEHDLYARLGARRPGIAALSHAQLTATSLPVQLHWCDRDSMAHGIESRAPFLDYRLVEFVLGCPDEFKIRDGSTKRLLRAALAERLPDSIAARQDKMGFVTPERAWITEQHPQQFVAMARAAVERAAGIVNERAFERARDIIERRRPFDLFVWRLICFGRWLDVFGVRHPLLSGESK